MNAIADAPTHHLSETLLLDYASGALDEASSILVASHLTLCAECRHHAETLDAVGGELIESVTPSSMAGDALDRIMARLDEPENTQQAEAPLTAVNDNPTLPRVLQRYLGGDLEGVDWKPIGMGVETADISLEGSASRAFLLKVGAGRAVPKHSHDGNEIVMVLKGAYRDECGLFRRGDVEIADSTTNHQPVADAGEDCVCLAVTDGPLRLTGPIGRWFNAFVRI